MTQETGIDSRAEKRPWRGEAWLLLAVVFAIGFVNFPMRVVGWQFEYVPGDGVDNRLNNFILEHGYRYLCGQEQSFWDAPDFYPARNTTAFSDTHLGMLPLYSLVRVLGFSPECAFQAWFVIPFILNFAAAAWALRRLGAGPAGVAIGAGIFAFGLPISGQFGHAQLLPRFLVPPAVVVGWEFLRSPRTVRLAVFCACVVYQIYVSVYIGYFLVLLLSAGLAVSLIRYSSQLPWQDLLRCGKPIWFTRVAVIAMSGLALLPLALAHGKGIGSVGPDCVRFLAPPPGGWSWPPNVALATPLLTNPDAPPEGEHRVFPGFIVLLAVGLSLFQILRSPRFGGWRSAATVAAWSTASLMLLVTVFPELWLYRPITELPGGCSIRAIGRVVLVLLFPMGIAVADCIDGVVNWARRASPALAFGAAIAAIGLVSLDNWLTSPEGERASVWIGERTRREVLVAQQQQIQAAILKHPAPRLVYVLPSTFHVPGRDLSIVLVITQLEAMRATQDLGIPCVNGYSGYFPNDWDYFRTRQEVLEWLQSQGVSRDLVVGLVIVEIEPPLG